MLINAGQNFKTDQVVSGSLSHHLVPAAAILLSMLVGGWMITASTGVIFQRVLYGLGHFYDYQAEAILAGKLNVPCNALHDEAFIVEGKCYGYFGIAPAVIRIFLNRIFSAYRGHWTLMLMLVASSIFLVSAYGLTLNLRRYLFGETPIPRHMPWMVGFFLLVLGLGSTNIFLLSRPMVYHEAILWSSAFALSSLFFAIHYLVTRRSIHLYLADAAALFAIHSRPLAGVAALMFCVGSVVICQINANVPRSGPRIKHYILTILNRTILVQVMIAFLIIISYGAVNFAKFGTIEGMPIRYQSKSYTPERLAKIDGAMFHKKNFRIGLGTYFGFYGFKNTFPYVNLPVDTLTDRELQARFPESSIDAVEPLLSVPFAMSALLVLACLGIYYCLMGGRGAKWLLWLLCVLLVGPVALLFFANLAYRYVHEFMLFLVFAGAIGINFLVANHGFRSEITRSLVMSAICFLGLLNVVANIYFTIGYQISDINSGLPAHPEMRDFVQRLERMLRTILG